MTSSNLIEQAKRGDPTAIATLMNRSLEPQGITASVERDSSRLQVLLEGPQLPSRDVLVTFVQNGISNLGLDDISIVEVAGKQTDQAERAWTHEWPLAPIAPEAEENPPTRITVPPPPAPPMPAGANPAANDDDAIPLDPVEDDPLADLLSIGDISATSSESDDSLEGLFGNSDASLSEELEASSLENDLLIDDDLLLSDDLSLEDDLLLSDDLSLEDDSSLESDLLLADDLSLEGDLSSDDNSSLEGDLLLADDLSLEGDLSLDDDSSLESDLLLEDDLSLEGDLLLEDDLLLEEDTEPTSPMPRAATPPAAAESSAVNFSAEPNEDFSEDIRAGFSDLEYRELETEPTDIGIDDDLAPELLAADAAQQIRNEIPEALLSDDPNVGTEGMGRDDFATSDLFASSSDDPLNLDEAGSARFPSINDLAVEGNLDFLETSELDESSELDDANEENLDFLETADLEADDGQTTSESDSNDFLIDPYPADLEEPETLPNPPSEITASPDMDLEEDIQLTSLEPEDEPLDWGNDYAEPDPTNDWGEVQDERETIETPVVEGEPPHGQMVGSPTAIQPLDDEEGSQSSEADSQSRGALGNLVLLFVAGWILALIGFSLWTELQSPAEPNLNPAPEASIKPRTA
ncbi:hypothetical protein [Vacuolonema iberomarrocanum]|uniref:hypothetical protein n=1 Tax=Vacuolonema iberomarrocanum TaxID=3454632 RepID=UPI0019E22E48|nr:hypothetical protein [filamentous cyanobacterium LEGE 07170]